MSQTGSIAPNFHEGRRSEYLAQYVFSSFGTAVAVPHQEDHGLDLICTLTERIGQRAWAKASYTVQVKSELKPWIFQGKNSVEWLVKHPLPFFLCVVNKMTSTLRVYHTAPRCYAWGLGDLPEKLKMIPTEETVGQSTQWNGKYKFSLVPILAIDIVRLADDEYWKNARKVLECWIEIDNNNLTRIRTGLHSWEMPDKYETNTMPRRSRITQWLSNPSEELLSNGIRHLSECLECIGTQFHNTNNVVAAVLIGLLYRHLHQKCAVFADDKNNVGGGLNRVFTALNESPLKTQNYFFSGVDELGKILENALQAEARPPRR